MHKALLPLVAALALAGCASGPSYQAPEPKVDAAFVQTAAPGEPVATFWKAFNDPALDALIAQALAANGDVKVAQARLAEVRALAGEADANRLPTLVLGASAGRGNETGFPIDNYVGVQATLNWELDFFGRLGRARESALAQVQAGEAGVDAARRVVGAEVATQYAALRGLQLRLRVAQESLLVQRETLRIVEVRNELGRGTPLDVARARALLDSTEAVIPALTGQIERTVYRIATLTGQSPRAAAAALSEAKPLPTLAATDLSQLPAGTPQSLLARRPDVRVAERQLAAATASIGVARADLYPRISLSGLLGFTNNRVADLFDTDGRSTNLGAALAWTPLDFGRVRARIGASEARAQQALATWEQTVANAIEETESALSGYTRTVQQTAKLESAARNAEEAARLARVRYEAGAIDLLAVLDAERTVLSARDALVQAQAGTVASLVGVYRALGGGWATTP
jgi:multidrug efflux system outer membrane protein